MESGELPRLHAGGPKVLVELDRDHPGFRDPDYRQRRNAIAGVALAHHTGTPVPAVEYVDAEHAVWRTVWDRLAPLHRELVCADLLSAQESLALDRARIPQLGALNPRLEAAAGFRMEPVAGLVAARVFLTYLGQRVFLSTQYIRHASRPFYTPEPDVVHELVGHAASLADARVTELSRAFGVAARSASDAEILCLERVYWYTLEFGVAEEGGVAKAYGAGLLSSAGELARLRGEAELVPLDLDRVAETTYDPTDFQPRLFVATGFRSALERVLDWLDSGAWRV
jgi:phenylalanine-4-hydroxylase